MPLLSLCPPATRAVTARRCAESPCDTTALRPLSVHITSPLGRTGVVGTVRIVAQIAHDVQTPLRSVTFFVDNIADGSKIDSQDNYSLRGSLRFQPTEDTTIDIVPTPD